MVSETTYKFLSVLLHVLAVAVTAYVVQKAMEEQESAEVKHYRPDPIDPV